MVEAVEAPCQHCSPVDVDWLQCGRDLSVCSLFPIMLSLFPTASRNVQPSQLCHCRGAKRDSLKAGYLSPTPALDGERDLLLLLLLLFSARFL